LERHGETAPVGGCGAPLRAAPAAARRPMQEPTGGCSRAMCARLHRAVTPLSGRGADHGLRLDLDQHVGVDEPAHLDHAGGGTVTDGAPTRPGGPAPDSGWAAGSGSAPRSGPRPGLATAWARAWASGPAALSAWAAWDRRAFAPFRASSPSISTRRATRGEVP